MSDFSCYITIINNTAETLTTNGYGNSWGYWKSTPPSSIAPLTSTAQFQLSDSSGPSGSTGWVNVAAAPGVLFSMNFNDPWSGSNSCGISMSGPAQSLFSVSYAAKTGSGSWQQNSCPSGGHPLYVNFSISKTLPRSPTATEVTTLKSAFPALNTGAVLVCGEATTVYNCIAWSLGISYTWINPPSPLSVFQTLYNTAADSTHGGGSGLSWRANSDWSTLPAQSSSASIDGWGLSITNMTHGSRLLQSADFPSAVWTSKLGEYLLITHNRTGLSGTNYGSILTSFAQVHPLPAALVADLERRHEELMSPETFTEAEHDTLEELVAEVPDSKKAQFATLYAKWLQAINERIPFSSDTRDGARLPEFAELVALGREILPLVVDRLCNHPQTDFRLVVLYDALQRETADRVRYDPADPHQFEGEPARAVRSAKLWLGTLLAR